MPASSSYASVILPLALRDSYTYHVPEKLQGSLQPGSRVLVSFGSKRIYTGIIREFLKEAPEGIELKSILDVLDPVPLVSEDQLRLWDWISSYYMCTPGEVMRAALPSGLRPESESRIRFCSEFEAFEDLDESEALLLKVIREEEECTLGDLLYDLSDLKPSVLLKGLVEKGAVEVNEFVRRSTSRKLRVYVKLSENFGEEASQHALLDQLIRAPRQKQIMERLLGFEEELFHGIARDRLLVDPKDAPALKAMAKKGLVEIFEREELGARIKEGNLKELSPAQQVALEGIREGFGTRQTVLLHGVASSGKTEIYLQLIGEMAAQAKQVLYLLPEIALTTQMIGRIRVVFGSRVGVYHSRYSDSERIHVYRNLLGLTDEEPYQVIVGARSALFLPLQNPGLIIIDEEHEYSYKQQDPAPRYHARDAAQVAALYQDARVLLGSATPSFESLYNARSGKFGLVELTERFGASLPPRIEISDIKQARKRKQMRSHFGPELRLAMEQTLGEGGQVILFQNRRGYSNYIVCKDCGHIPTCRRCDVSLTYHKISAKLECHYCGHKEYMPQQCPACGSVDMHMQGFGTEKIEDELINYFPDARAGRLDTDAARSVRATQKLLRDFEEGKTQILVGTQMLSKGLDFSGVSLVGVLDADAMMHFPDFRAFERSYQLISQVSGRAGRRDKQGRVIIQTADPEHPVVGYLLRQDLDGLYRDQMEEREVFGYPPFRRIIRLSMRHKISSIVDGAADLLARDLREIFTTRVLGPQYPPVRKTHNYFVKHITLKIERDISYEKARSLLKEVMDNLSEKQIFRQVRVSIDVDPY